MLFLFDDIPIIGLLFVVNFSLNLIGGVFRFGEIKKCY